jgi:hypothetical protein
LNGITARREADVSPFDELVKLPTRVRSGTHIDDAFGGAFEFYEHAPFQSLQVLWGEVTYIGSGG